MLIFAVGYNIWLYRLEPSAKIDPNDNPFQYALVHRTNEMWDFAAAQCAPSIGYPVCFTSYLVDHWVPNWAQGFNLPYYYSHWPQIMIVASWKIIHLFSAMTLFEWYHVVIFLLLCIFPICVFWGLRVLKLPWMVVGFGAIAATQVSTDGLYGLDPSSFLWRGYGLSSQLFSMIFLPMAIAYSYRFLIEELRIKKYEVRVKDIKSVIRTSYFILHTSSFLPAVLFLVLSVSGHLGIGVLAMMSVGFLAVSFPIIAGLEKQTIKQIIAVATDKIGRMLIMCGTAIAIISYFVVPVMKDDSYHNISFWDPVWKFNSWGWKEVMQQFLNGNLFDFGRLPVLTLLILLGCFFVYFVSNKKPTTHNSQLTTDNLQPFSFLFFFWLLFFFGRATWGGLIDLIPSMKDFHQSRFIVGLHLSGFFLAPIGYAYVLSFSEKLLKSMMQVGKKFLKTLDTEETETEAETEKNSNTNVLSPAYKIGLSVLLTFTFFLMMSPQTNAYGHYNDFLIKRGNENFDKQNPDVVTLFAELKKLPPGRVFTGRGGSWGKKLQIAETTYFMHLSTYGVPVILWLPETWSPMSDVEQFFVEENPDHYNLMNVRYVVTPPDVTPQSFWKFITQTPSWKLYSVNTEGYFTTGSLATVVYSKKEHYINLVRLWLQSDYPKQKIFPELTFNKKEMMQTPLPAFGMIDESIYQTRDGKLSSLFGETPVYMASESAVTLSGADQTDHDMILKTTVNVGNDCTHCLVILKQSSHPNWQAWVNGKPSRTFTVFPFYRAVEVSQPGTNTIEFRYVPSPVKMMLFLFGGLLFIILFLPWKRILDLLHVRHEKSSSPPS